MKVVGKVLETGERSNAPDDARRYRFAWVRVMDARLHELVEVTAKLNEGDESPFAQLQTGQHFESEVWGARMYRNTLTVNIATDAKEAAPGDDDLSYAERETA